MKQPLKERIYWTAAATALAVTLCVLAVLQYHWSRELDEAASTRMRANLQASMAGVRLDLARELSSIPHAPQRDPAASGADQAAAYAGLLQSWKRSAAHPDLVTNVYLASQASLSQRGLLRLDIATGRYVATDWPSSLASLKESLKSVSEDLVMAPPPRPHARRREAEHGRTPPGFSPESRWFIEPDTPALLQIVERPASPENRPGQAKPAVDWVIVELNAGVLREQVFPELAERYFGGTNGLTYDVAIFGKSGSKLIYSSTQQLQAASQITPDARLFLFGPPFGVSRPPNHAEARPFLLPRDERAGAPDQRSFIPLRIELLRFADHRDSWELLVKHRKGSLEAALASLRRQHLMISFGAWLLLAATIAMVILATRRAHKLARQQMDFVAGVSHELRTPLAVIASAGDNIADGIITDQARLVRYGDVIRKHARQLTQLVEQILLFSAAGKQSYQYSITRVQPGEIVRTALDRSAELLSDFTVVKEIEPALPDVLVDASAVSHCLQNLISNALKYSGENRWIRIRAHMTHGSHRAVQISVEDKGIGIAHDELRHIFDPFYRSPEVVAAQIRGTGLGLALARNIAESLGGRLSASSELGKGSTFTLQLPIAEGAAPSAPAASLTTAAAVPMKDETQNSDR